MSVGRFLQQGAAGNAGAGVYVDDVFSTYLYDGATTSRTINNGIDLAGEGGMVWLKQRSGDRNNAIFDTERGEYILNTDGTGAEANGYVSSFGAFTFSSTGFSTGTAPVMNENGYTHASWTFRKQPGFFDVVTYTGTGSTQTISHNLGATVGTLIIKRTNGNGNWSTFARTGGNAGSTLYAYFNSSAGLNLTAAAGASGVGAEGLGYITTTGFKPHELSGSSAVGNVDNINDSGATYVAYLFAHDDQRFGTGSDESIIKCGSYTGTGSAQDINLGFEPQWLLVKSSTTSDNWRIIDVMRGWTADGLQQNLNPNANFAENSTSTALKPTADGFSATGSNMNNSGVTYIYVAIRRPHKPASALTANDVFSVKTYAATTSSASVTHDVVFDAEINANKDVSIAKFLFVDQLRGINGVVLKSSGISQEQSYPTFWSRKNMYTMYAPSQFDAWWSSSSGTNNHISYALKRAPGFFDVVAYTGTGVSGLTVTHNLTVSPQLVILKNRTASASWFVLSNVIDGSVDYGNLNTADAFVDSSWFVMNSSNFIINTTGTSTNAASNNYIAYLFATVPGISKVGSYSGTGSDVNVNCGFTSGARFVLVKRTDSTGDWYVWDSVRGIVAGNDPYLLLNSDVAQVTSTDYIDPLSSGFTITSTAPAALNASGGTYIFLAIA